MPYTEAVEDVTTMTATPCFLHEASTFSVPSTAGRMSCASGSVIPSLKNGEAVWWQCTQPASASSKDPGTSKSASKSLRRSLAPGRLSRWLVLDGSLRDRTVPWTCERQSLRNTRLNDQAGSAHRVPSLEQLGDQVPGNKPRGSRHACSLSLPGCSRSCRHESRPKVAAAWPAAPQSIIDSKYQCTRKRIE
jgi:hypothetical protein